MYSYMFIPQVSKVCSSSDVVRFIPHCVQVSFPLVDLNVFTGHVLQDEPSSHLPAGQTVCEKSTKMNQTNEPNIELFTDA